MEQGYGEVRNAPYSAHDSLTQTPSRKWIESQEAAIQSASAS